MLNAPQPWCSTTQLRTKSQHLWRSWLVRRNLSNTTITGLFLVSLGSFMCHLYWLEIEQFSVPCIERNVFQIPRFRVGSYQKYWLLICNVFCFSNQSLLNYVGCTEGSLRTQRGPMQGWDLVCWWVLGIPLFEIRKMFRFTKFPFHVLIDMKFTSKLLEIFLNHN